MAGSSPYLVWYFLEVHGKNNVDPRYSALFTIMVWYVEQYNNDLSMTTLNIPISLKSTKTHPPYRFTKLWPLDTVWQWQISYFRLPEEPVNCLDFSPMQSWMHQQCKKHVYSSCPNVLLFILWFSSALLLLSILCTVDDSTRDRYMKITILIYLTSLDQQEITHKSRRLC